MAYSGLAFEPAVHLQAADHKPDSTYQRPPATARADSWRRSLEAVGRGGDVVVRDDSGQAPGALTMPALKARVARSLSHGLPVIIEGLPEDGAVSLITGYEQRGDVLCGWSTNWGGPSILFEPAQERRFESWFAPATAVVLVGAKIDSNPIAADRRMLQQAVAILNRQEFAGHLAGRAAYEAWAVALDDGVSVSDAAKASAAYDPWIDPNIWDLAERRHYARVVLDMRAGQWPDQAASEARLAAAEFAAIHDLMWEINRTGGASSPGSKLPKIGDSTVRRQIGVLIRRAADHDAAASVHLAKALEILNQASAALQGP
jgi:hypothetical protein